MLRLTTDRGSQLKEFRGLQKYPGLKVANSFLIRMADTQSVPCASLQELGTDIKEFRAVSKTSLKVTWLSTRSDQQRV